MNNFIEMGILIWLMISLSINLVYIYKLKKLYSVYSEIYDKFTDLEIKSKESVELIKRLQLANMKYEPTTPITSKKNNWDSVRNVFKKPNRVDIDEPN